MAENLESNMDLNEENFDKIEHDLLKIIEPSAYTSKPLNVDAELGLSPVKISKEEYPIFSKTNRHPYDLPYNADALDFVRSHLHNSIVRRVSNFKSDDYIILFDEQREGIDHAIQAGVPIQILIPSSPYQGERVEHLVRRVFNQGDKFLNQFKRSKALVKKSDHAQWCGVEVSGTSDSSHQKEELKFYQRSFTFETYITLTLYDPETGRKITVRQRNSNALDAEVAAMKLMKSKI